MDSNGKEKIVQIQRTTPGTGLGENVCILMNPASTFYGRIVLEEFMRTKGRPESIQPSPTSSKPLPLQRLYQPGLLQFRESLVDCRNQGRIG